MINIKKVVAGASAIAILTMNMMNFTANATSVAVTWITRISATSYTLTSAAGFITWVWASCTVKVTDSTNPVNTYTFTWSGCTVTDANNLALINSAHDFNNSYVTATFTTSNTAWATSFGAGTATIWVVASGTQNNVQVTATVEPILSMTVSNNILAFGSLNSATVTQAMAGDWVTPHITLWVATNATAGTIVTMASANAGKLVDWTNNIIAQISDPVAGTAWVAYRTNWKTWASTIADLTYLNLSAPVTILNTNNLPTASTTVNIEGRATVSPVTPAGNYTDNLTFTVTGTF